MTCGEVSGLLDRLMDGELTDEERRAMEAHGRDCPDCAEAIRATARMKALFDEMEREADVPLAAQARWRGAVREAAKQKKRARMIRWIGSAAAAVVVLAGVGLAMNLRNAPARDAQNAAAELVEVSEVDEADEVAESAVNTAGEATKKTVVDSAGETDSAYEADIAYEVDTAYEAEEAYEAEPERAMVAEEAAPVMEIAAESAAEAAPMSAGEVNSAAEAAPMSAGESAPVIADAEEDMSDADFAVLEADGETSNVCAALAQRAPACEVRFRVEDPDRAWGMICDLASEYEADTDVQFLDEGGTNVYVEIASGEAEAFLKAVASIGTPEGEAQLPDANEGETVLMLVELLPEN